MASSIRSMRERRSCAVAAFGGLILCAAGAPVQAEYRIQRGDVLNITVFGSPELARRASVDIDGQTTLPLVGPVAVAGMSIAEVRSGLRDLLSQGKLLRDPEVTVEVAEYRPVYVKGDVLSAGVFPYRPGMTIRQVLALSGGSGLKGGGSADVAASAAADLQGDYAALSTDLAGRLAHLDRLRAELQDKPSIDFTGFRTKSLSPVTAAKFQELEAQQFTALRSNNDKTADHLKVMAGFASDQLDTLVLQRKEVEDTIRLQADEVDKVKGLFNKGLITSTRLSDEQRSLSSARTQLLANIAQAGDVRRLKADFDDRVRQQADDHVYQTMKDFQQTLAEVEKLRVHITTAGQKLAALKGTTAPPAAGAPEERHIVVYRAIGTERNHFEAMEDSEVLPGDVVEIRTDGALVLGMTAPAQSVPQAAGKTVQADPGRKPVNE